jgi:uncharacterized protein YraI
VFEPFDIIDPSEKFLEAKEDSATLEPTDRRRRVDRASFWLAGSVIYAVSTLILAISLGPWGEPQIGQTPAPGPTSAPLAKPDSSAEPAGVTSSKPSIESEQKVPPVVEPAQVDPAPEVAPETPTPGASEERVSVTTAASIRAGPSSSSDIIGTAPPGAEAAVASRESDWVQIVDPVAGKTGWIHSASLAPSTEDAASTESGEQRFEVPDEAARSATVAPKPRAKAKKYRRWKRHFGRRGIRLRFAFRRFR